MPFTSSHTLRVNIVEAITSFPYVAKFLEKLTDAGPEQDKERSLCTQRLLSALPRSR